MKWRFLGLLFIACFSLFALAPFIKAHLEVQAVLDTGRDLQGSEGTWLFNLGYEMLALVPFLLGILAYWYRLCRGHALIFLTGFIMLLPAIGMNFLYGFSVVYQDQLMHYESRKKSEASDALPWNKLEHADGVEFANYSEKYIYWPISSKPVGIRVKWDMVLPHEFAGHEIVLGEPYILDGRALSKVDSDQQLPFRNMFNTSLPLPLGLHTPSVGGGGFLETKRTFTYDLYPLNMVYRFDLPDKSLTRRRLCFFESESTAGASENTGTIIASQFMENGAFWRDKKKPLNIDLTSKLTRFIAGHSSLITPQNIAMLYGNLNPDMVIAVGYETCSNPPGYSPAHVTCFEKEADCK
jgi:hypothetical protein